MIPFGRNGCFDEIRVCKEYTEVDYNRLREAKRTTLHGDDKNISPSRFG